LEKRKLNPKNQTISHAQLLGSVWYGRKREEEEAREWEMVIWESKRWRKI